MHYTAWLVNDASCLDQGCMDITILVDAPSGEDGWTSTTEQAFYAVTTVPADGDVEDGIREAESLMQAAGWALLGKWEATPNAYIITAERA